MCNKVLVPLITPFDENLNVCESSVEALIGVSLEYVGGYVPCLTSGEGWRLDAKQWQSMCLLTRKYALNRDVIAGIERPGTEEVIKFAILAEKIGVNGVIFTSQFDSNATQEDIYRHYQRVHDSVDINIYIYNESELSENTLSEETLIEISKLSRVRGIKNSSDSITFQSIVPTLKNNGVEIFQGWENKIVDDELADGNICSLSNLYPKLCLDAVKNPSVKLAEEINELCSKHFIFADDWYRYIKIYLHELGVITTPSVLANN